jgi:hypothetical protein
MLYRLLADLIVIFHLGFVLFAVFGGFLVFKWEKLAWLHVPAFLWAALIEFAGWACPLTPLENKLRELADETPYHSDFVGHYLLPLLYPAELTRNLQVILGVLVLGGNLGIYGWLLWRARQKRERGNL